MLIVGCFRGKEDSVSEQLLRLGDLEVFAPKVKKVKGEVLMYPGMLFVESKTRGDIELGDILVKEGFRIIRLNGGGYYVLDAAEADRIRGFNVEYEPEFKVGDHVVVTEGMFKGYRAHIESLTDTKVGLRVELAHNSNIMINAPLENIIKV